jgi:hypothetical protein
MASQMVSKGTIPPLVRQQKHGPEGTLFLLLLGRLEFLQVQVLKLVSDESSLLNETILPSFIFSVSLLKLKTILKHNMNLYVKGPYLRQLSEKLTLAIPSSYLRKMNQMIAHQTQDLYWFTHVGYPSLVGVMLLFLYSYARLSRLLLLAT